MTRPGTSGLSLARRLREDTRTKDAGIIVLTGSVVRSATDRAAAADCDRVLLKPCLPDALALEIRDVILTRRLAS